MLFSEETTLISYRPDVGVVFDVGYAQREFGELLELAGAVEAAIFRAEGRIGKARLGETLQRVVPVGRQRLVVDGVVVAADRPAGIGLFADAGERCDEMASCDQVPLDRLADYCIDASFGSIGQGASDDRKDADARSDNSTQLITFGQRYRIRGREDRQPRLRQTI